MKVTAVLLLVFCLSKLNAQTTRLVSGVVKDSAGTAIEGATVKLSAGNDTIHSTTDKSGGFLFKNIQINHFTLFISSTGYEPFTGSYEFKKEESSLNIDAVLKTRMHKLEEVVVKTVVVPITVKEDTIEYDARAYLVRDGDLVEDLLKQLPGVEVDADGNVKAEGKNMTKLRVNGEDFFTSDVTTFIKQLPAHIISKLQVINDYGDEANFTGIKSGGSQKMLNLITKPGMDRGTFGSTGVTAGTNSVVNVSANSNFWRGSKQISANGSLGYADNKSLTSSRSGASTSYRDMWGKKLSFNSSYSFSNSNSKNNSNIYSETFYPSGSLYNDITNSSQNRSNGHSLQMGLNYNRDKTNYFTLQGSFNYSSGVSSQMSVSHQKGIVRQDLQNEASSNRTAPTFSGSVHYSHRFKKAGRVVSLSANMGGSTGNNMQQLLDHFQYYNAGIPVKDSLLNRLVQSYTTSSSTNISIAYSEPINKNNHIGLSYSYSSSRSGSRFLTEVLTIPGIYKFVDSLSNVYHNTFATQNLGINYGHTSKRFNYTAGLQLQPNTLNGEYADQYEGFHRTTFNYAPSINLNFDLSKTASLSAGYGGQSAAPGINQLQPVRDTRNIQNIIIGNPNLKPSFNNDLNVSFSKYSAKGAAFMLSANGSAVRNQVVTDVVLIQDTIAGSLKQETYYRNASGSYNAGASYTVSYPFLERKLGIDLTGGLGYSRTVSFSNHIMYDGSNTQLSQSLRFRLNSKRFGVNGGVHYANNKYNNTLGATQNITVNTWQYSLAASVFLPKKFRAGISANKRVNSGYNHSITSNPLYISANASTSFLKKDAANLSIQINDLLNQGNVPSRTITNNAVIDSRINNVTRYVTVTCSIRLNKLGGKK